MHERERQIILKDPENSIYPRFYYTKLPTFLYQTKQGVLRNDHKKLFRDNSARSCNWKVIFIKGCFFWREYFFRPKTWLKEQFQFSDFLSYVILILWEIFPALKIQHSFQEKSVLVSSCTNWYKQLWVSR